MPGERSGPSMQGAAMRSVGPSARNPSCPAPPARSHGRTRRPRGASDRSVTLHTPACARAASGQPPGQPSLDPNHTRQTRSHAPAARHTKYEGPRHHPDAGQRRRQPVAVVEPRTDARRPADDRCFCDVRRTERRAVGRLRHVLARKSADDWCFETYYGEIAAVDRRFGNDAHVLQSDDAAHPWALVPQGQRLDR